MYIKYDFLNLDVDIQNDEIMQRQIKRQKIDVDGIQNSIVASFYIHQNLPNTYCTFHTFFRRRRNIQ